MAIKIWAGSDGAWSTAGNWSPSGVPTNSDDVYIEDSSQGITSGLGQSAVTLASLNIGQSFTGEIGDATTYLDIGATICNVGYSKGFGSPAGSARIKIDLGTIASTCTIHNTGSTPTDANLGAVQLLADQASTDIQIKKGKVTIAGSGSETATFDKLIVSYDTSKASDANVTLGPGVDIASIDQLGGKVNNYSNSAAAAIEVTGGTHTIEGSGAVTALTADGGTVTASGTGTITTAKAKRGGVIDWTKSDKPRTVTNTQLDANGTLKISDVVTYTNGIVTNEKQLDTSATAV